MNTRNMPVPCRRTRLHKDNKGFSLVELIIVIAIMAVLTALLAPQFLKYVEKARIERDRANIQAVVRVFNLACIEYGDQSDANAVYIVSGGAAYYYENGQLGSINNSLMVRIEEAFGKKRGGPGTTNSTNYIMLEPLTSKLYKDWCKSHSGRVKFLFKNMDSEGNVTSMGTGGNNGGMFVLAYEDPFNKVYPPV